jgi:hypothetical protein
LEIKRKKPDRIKEIYS